jgi:hypothetical protein
MKKRENYFFNYFTRILDFFAQIINVYKIEILKKYFFFNRDFRIKENHDTKITLKGFFSYFLLNLFL